MSDPIPKATRFLGFEETLTGEGIIDAVREVAGRNYIEELFFADDEVLYLVGQRDGAPSGNVFVAVVREDWMENGLDQTMLPVIKPDMETAIVVVMHGYVGPLRHSPPKTPPDDIQCYLAVKDFAEKLRLALVARIADPGMVAKRPPVHADASKLPRKP